MRCRYYACKKKKRLKLMAIKNTQDFHAGSDVARLNKVRVPSLGTRLAQLSSPSPPKTMLVFWRSTCDKDHERGVGFLLSKKARDCLLGYKPVCPRIIVARFSGQPFNITVYQV